MKHNNGTQPSRYILLKYLTSAVKKIMLALYHSFTFFIFITYVTQNFTLPAQPSNYPLQISIFRSRLTTTVPLPPPEWLQQTRLKLTCRTFLIIFFVYRRCRGQPRGRGSPWLRLRPPGQCLSLAQLAHRLVSSSIARVLCICLLIADVADLSLLDTCLI